MAFVKNLASSGMFGLAGLAASSGGSKNKKPPPSLTTGDYPSSSTSLLNSKQGY